MIPRQSCNRTVRGLPAHERHVEQFLESYLGWSKQPLRKRLFDALRPSETTQPAITVIEILTATAAPIVPTMLLVVDRFP